MNKLGVAVALIATAAFWTLLIHWFFLIADRGLRGFAFGFIHMFLLFAILHILCRVVGNKLKDD